MFRLKRAPVGLSARAPVGWMPESIFDVRSKIQELLGTKAQRSANQDAWQSQEDIEAAQSTENHQETTPEAWYYPRDAQPGHIKS